MIDKIPKKVSIKNPYFLIISVIIAVAFLLRIIGLGSFPLDESEAGNALSAFAILQSKAPNANAQPLYINITSLIFWIAGTSNFNARLFPAIIGSMFCLLPLAIRRQTGLRVSLILAGLIAIEPTFVNISRRADSTILAISFFTAAMVFFWKEQKIITGVCVGLALLSGSRVWLMVLGLLLSWIAWKVILLLKRDVNEGERSDQKFIPKIKRSFPFRILIVSIVIIVLLGTLFLTQISQINGAIGGLLEFISGWKNSFNVDSISAEYFSISLITTCIFGFILFTIKFIDGIIKKESVSIFLGIYTIIMIIILIIWPGRSTSDISLIITTSILLIAIQIKKNIESVQHNPKVSIISSVMQFSLIVFAYLNLLWLLKNYMYATTEVTLHAIAAIVAIILVFAISILEVWGWSWKVAQSGLLITLLACFVFFCFHQTFKTLNLNNTSVNNPLTDKFIIGEDLLKDSIVQIALMNGRNPESIDIAIEGDTPDSLKWAMVSYSTTSYPSGITPLTTPSIIVSFLTDIPKLAFEYRGQEIIWSKQLIFEEMNLMDWINWALFSGKYYKQTPLMLWIRSDLLPEKY